MLFFELESFFLRLFFFFHGDCAQMIYFLARSHENYSALHENTSWDFFMCWEGGFTHVNFEHYNLMWCMDISLSLSLSLCAVSF